MNFTTISKQKAFNGMQSVCSHYAQSTQCDMQFSIFVPDGADRNHPCAALFYLSGLTCTHENVTTKSGFQRYASEKNFIIVCPDTSPRGSNYPQEHESYDFGSGAGFYLNATQQPWAKSYKMYDYIVDELPDLLYKYFPVDDARYGIFGHSMGGHGALTIGLRNPDLFQSISAFAPIVAPMQVPWGKKAFTHYLGDDQQLWKIYDASELIKSGYCSQNKILIDQGTADEFLAEQLKPEIFQQVCQQNDQPLELRMQQGYDHSYYFIASFMQQHLEFHYRNFQNL